MKRIFDIRSVSCENVLVGFVILSGVNFSKQIMVLKGLNFPDTLILKSKSKKEKRMKTSNSERILLPLYFVMVGVAVCLNFFSGAKPDMANLVVNISMFIIIGDSLGQYTVLYAGQQNDQKHEICRRDYGD